MMRNFAIAMIATTMLVAPALAAETVKPAQTTAPSAPAAVTNSVKSDKDLKTNGTAKPAVKTIKADKDLKSGAAPAAEVATVKGDKDSKSVKVATQSHRHHSHHWYMVHRGKPSNHVIAAEGSKPVKHADVHKARKEIKTEGKSNKVPSDKHSS
jgi:hypothetical protein